MLRIAADPRVPGSMKKAKKVVSDPDMRAEYDFASMKGGVRGKYAGRNVWLMRAFYAQWEGEAEILQRPVAESAREGQGRSTRKERKPQRPTVAELEKGLARK